MGIDKKIIEHGFGRNYEDVGEIPDRTVFGKVLRFFYQFHKWLIFVPILAFSTFFFGSLAVALCTVLPAKLVSRICGATWARLNSWLTPMVVTVIGQEHINEDQSYVVVSNHQSHFDIFVLYGWLTVDFKWVMKAELRKVPFLGVACEKLDHIFIDRSNHQAAIDSINQAKKRIVGGTSVIFFPEGTRSKSGKLQPFKKGAFRFALDLGVPILPVTILGTKDILPRGTVDLFPGRAQMIIHPPIQIDGRRHRDVEALAAEVAAVIRSGIPADY